MRFARPFLAAVVMAAALVGPASVESAAAATGCRADQVTVVVDFGSLGGGTAVRCVTNPTSGLDALAKAGFGYGFRPNFPGMVCTIDARPNPCNGAPPDAYWAYWHGPAGGGWTYTTQGAGSRKPPAGSVEGWAFGDDRRPSVSPPAATPPPTTATTAPPTTHAPVAPAAPTVPPTTSSAPQAPDRATTSSSTITTTTVGATVTTATSAPSSTTSTDGVAGRSSDSGSEVTELAVDRASASSGGGTGAIIGIAVLIAVAGAAGWEFRRRRIT